MLLRMLEINSDARFVPLQKFGAYYICNANMCAYVRCRQERIDELCDNIPTKTRDAFIKNNSHSLLTKKLIQRDQLRGKQQTSNLQKSMSIAERRAFFRESRRDQSRFEDETKIHISTPPRLHQRRDKTAPSAPEKSLHGSRRGEQSASIESSKPAHSLQLEFTESVVASDQRINAPSTHSPTMKWNGDSYFPSTFEIPQKRDLFHQPDGYGAMNETSESKQRIPDPDAPASLNPRNPTTAKIGNTSLRSREKKTLFKDEVDTKQNHQPFQSAFDTKITEDPTPPKYPLSPETFMGAVPKYHTAGGECSRRHPSMKVSSPKAFQNPSSFRSQCDNTEAFSLLENVKYVHNGLSNIPGMGTFMKEQMKTVESNGGSKYNPPNNTAERVVHRFKEHDAQAPMRHPEAQKLYRRESSEIPPRKDMLRPSHSTKPLKDPLKEDMDAALKPPGIQPKMTSTRKLLFTLFASLSIVFGCSGLLRVGRILKTSIEYHRMLTLRMEQFESSILESHLAVKKLEENYAMWTEYVHVLAQEDEKDALSHLEKVQEDVKKWRVELKQDMVNFRHALSQELGELANVSRDLNTDANR